MTTAEELEQKARQLIDDRMATVRQLAHTAGEVEATDALEGARREHATAWAAAQKAGWTATELTKIGVPAPKASRNSRPRKQRAAKNNDAVTHAHDHA